MDDLSIKKCVPCEKGTPPLEVKEIKDYLSELGNGWTLTPVKSSKAGIYALHKLFNWVNFKEAMEFVNKVADLAETEGHHPDVLIHYNKVEIILWTHSIQGLSENDFILATKIDNLN